MRATCGKWAYKGHPASKKVRLRPSISQQVVLTVALDPRGDGGLPDGEDGRDERPEFEVVR
jgi:hypothetical protein